MHGYCTTSHASQGKTVDRVLIAMGAESFPAASQQQFYVSVSRGRKACTIDCADKRELLDAVGRSEVRTSATELAAQEPRGANQRKTPAATAWGNEPPAGEGGGAARGGCAKRSCEGSADAGTRTQTGEGVGAMNDSHKSQVESVRRLAESRRGLGEASPPEDEAEIVLEPEETAAAFSIISADRQQKVMLELRLLNGNVKGLPYSYLAGLDFDPTEGIQLDFTAYAVKISGRNLRPLVDGLLAQRVAVIRMTDEFQAEANMPDEATVVTSIDIKRID